MTKITKKDIEEGKACAALSYLFPIGLIWYLADEKMKKNKFVAHHVYQSLAAAIGVFAFYFVGGIIPIIGWFLIIPIGMLASLVWFIQGLIYSLGGETKELLFLGWLAKKFTF